MTVSPEQLAWDKAIKHVLEWEGGYSNDPDDPGGETRWGISKRGHPALDIKNLTVEQARAIYRNEYWREVEGDKLPEPLAIMMMDSAVNCGISRSVKWLQKVLRVQQDGNLGPVTLAAVKTQTAIALAKEVADQRERHYRLLRQWPRFGRGWMNRLNACRRLCGLHVEQ